MSIHRRKLLLLIQIILLFGSSKAAFLCDPAADCAAGQIGALVPDPDDCHNYYLCVDSGGQPVPSNNFLPCPVGTYFDQTTASCETETGTCNNACNRICQTSCEIALDLIPDPNDCSKYFICLDSSGSVATALCVAPTQYFNGTGCSANIYECCDACVPYCFEPATQVQDPNDCKRYYICTAAMTTPEEQYHFTCEPGIFDPKAGVCDQSTTNCTNYCL